MSLPRPPNAKTYSCQTVSFIPTEELETKGGVVDTLCSTVDMSCEWHICYTVEGLKGWYIATVHWFNAVLPIQFGYLSCKSTDLTCLIAFVMTMYIESVQDDKSEQTAQQKLETWKHKWVTLADMYTNSFALYLFYEITYSNNQVLSHWNRGDNVQGR